MKVMLAQVNPTIGDIEGNVSLVKQRILSAISMDCDVVLFPELVLVGYPPRDLLYKNQIWEDNEKAVDDIEAFIRKHNNQITVIFGGLHQVMLSGGRYARYNAAWIIDRHFGRRVVHKKLLPCYDVFDETRYFTPSTDPYVPIKLFVRGSVEMCDVLICEDIWNNEYCGGEENMKPATYDCDPVADVALYGKGPLFILNGSPFWINKIRTTEELLVKIARRIFPRPVFWCNQIGAHDDIITGGYSKVVGFNINGQVNVRQGKAFEEDSIVVEVDEDSKGKAVHNLHIHCPVGRTGHPIQIGSASMFEEDLSEQDFKYWTIYKALCLHLNDYKRRCGFERAVLGLSGGIDSSVVAVIATHVFGKNNVCGLSMPSPYSSSSSIDDALALAKNLGIICSVKDISELYEDVKKLFLRGGKQKFNNPIADENIQSKVRANVLTTYSNEFDPCLLLTTGNKSEISVGYCTLYGDTCGGIAPLADLWKTEVFGLALFMNKYFDNVIPGNVLVKAPSAELRPNQKDTDSLPPYEILDEMLKAMVENEKTPTQVLSMNDSFRQKLDAYAASINETTLAVLRKIHRMYVRSEFKRQQMAVGAKLQKRSFGSGRRMPIAMKLRSNA